MTTPEETAALAAQKIADAAKAVLVTAEAAVTAAELAKQSTIDALSRAESDLASGGATAEARWKQHHADLDLHDAKIRALASACAAPRRAHEGAHATAQASWGVVERIAQAERMARLHDGIDALDRAQVAFSEQLVALVQSAAACGISEGQLGFLCHDRRVERAGMRLARTTVDRDAPQHFTPEELERRAREYGKLSDEHRMWVCFLLETIGAMELCTAAETAEYPGPDALSALARGDYRSVSAPFVEKLKRGLQRAMTVAATNFKRAFSEQAYRTKLNLPSRQPDAPHAASMR